LDPVPRLEKVEVPIFTEFREEAQAWATIYGWQLSEKSGSARPVSSRHGLLLLLAQAVAASRGRSGESMRGSSAPAGSVLKPQVAILGKSRITEALIRHFQYLGWMIRNLDQPTEPGLSAWPKGSAVADPNCVI
jgi:hypothetical protein